MCKVPLNQFWCHFLLFRQDLRQALHGKWWFFKYIFFNLLFLNSPPPFSPTRLRNAAVLWAAATYHLWDSCPWLEDGVICVSLPGFCQILIWSPLDVPCMGAAVHYLFKLALHRSTTTGENCAQLSKCFFTWITVAIWAVLKSPVKHFLLNVLLGVSSFSVLKQKLVGVPTL